MKSQPVWIALTIVNLFLLILLLAQQHPAVAANEAAPVLRGRALEIVDAQGRVRASITVLPDSETTLLRLITERGRPSVKIAASEPQSGLSFVGPTGTNDTYVQLWSRDKASMLRLKNEDGGERIVTP